MNYKLYDTLNISKDATDTDIKKSYKKLAFQWHPDKNKDKKEEAEKKFKEISNAYTVLSDENERRKYDQLGDDNYNNNGTGEHEINPMDIFERFFGNGMGHPFAEHSFGGHGFRHHFSFNDFNTQHTSQVKKCKSVCHSYNASLDDVYKGINKNMKITLKKYCKYCVVFCDKCQGRGIINQVKHMGIFTQMFTGPCDRCQGTGHKINGNKKCEICKGQGTYEKEQNAHLSIPPGVEDGFKTVFPDLGEQPMHDKQIPGDLIFEIKVMSHKHFVRKNNDLYYRKEITFIESIIGTDIEIDYFNEIIKINTLEHFGVISPTKQYMVENKGMPFMNSNDKKGNMIIEFNIVYPEIKNKRRISELKTLLEDIF